MFLGLISQRTPGVFVSKWGTSGQGDGEFNTPSDVAVAPDGSVYVLDSSNKNIQKFTSSGVFVSRWGGSSGCYNGHFQHPQMVAVASDGSVYVTDVGCQRIQKFTSAGVFVSKWGTLDGSVHNTGSGDGEFNAPWDVAVAPDGSVYVVDSKNYRIQKFSVGP